MAIAFRASTVTLTTGGVSGAQTIGPFSGTQPAAGDAVFVGGAFQASGGATAVAITDNQGNGTYTNDEFDVDASAVSRTFISSKFGVATGASFSCTITTTPATGEFISVGAIAISGVLAPSALDVHTSLQTNNSNTTTVSTGTTGVTAIGDEVALISLSSLATVNVSTITALGYTITASEPNGTAKQVGAFGYQVLTATGAQSATWTFGATSGLSTDNHVAAIAVYKGSSAPMLMGQSRQQFAMGLGA